MPAALQQGNLPDCMPLALTRALTSSFRRRYDVELEEKDVAQRLRDAGREATSGWSSGLSMGALQKAWRGTSRTGRSIEVEGTAAVSYEIAFDDFEVEFETACEILRNPTLGFSLLVIESPDGGLAHCLYAEAVGRDDEKLQCINSQNRGRRDVPRDLFVGEEIKARSLAIRAKLLSIVTHVAGRQQHEDTEISLFNAFKKDVLAYDEECERKDKDTWLRRKLNEELWGGEGEAEALEASESLNSAVPAGSTLPTGRSRPVQGQGGRDAAAAAAAAPGRGAAAAAAAAAAPERDGSAAAAVADARDPDGQLRERILSVLSGEKPKTALEIAKLVVGPKATKKDVNRLLYKMKDEKILRYSDKTSPPVFSLPA